MASVGDYIFLVIVIAIIGGIAYAVKGASVQDGINKQKEAMKAKGINLSSDGLSVKTNKVKVSREEEVNRAQASWAKSGEMMGKHKAAFKYGPGTTDPAVEKAAAANNAKKKS